MEKKNKTVEKGEGQKSFLLIGIGLILIGISAIILGILFFASEREEKNPQMNTEQTVIRTDIAFIDLDSLVSGYQMTLDLRDDLQKKANTIQKDLEQKARVLDNDLSDLENRMRKGIISGQEAGQLKNSLLQRDQDLQVFSAQKQREMAEAEQIMIHQVMESIKAYVRKYNETHAYSLILTTNGATNTVLTAQENCNITDEILKGINREYSQKEK